MKTQAIRIDTIDSSKSTVRDVEQFGTLNGEFTGISRGHDGTTIVHLAPFSTIRQQPLISEAFVQILPEDASNWDSVISGRSIEMVWENEHQQGFLVTSFGNIVEFETISDEEELTMISVIVMVAVTVSVPGVVLGLIYMNSPYLQRKYLQLRGFDKK